MTKPSIVFCHVTGRSCFNKVISARYPRRDRPLCLDTFAAGVAAVKRTLGWVSRPAFRIVSPATPNNASKWPLTAKENDHDTAD
jgi:hypothetical protein